ncbi:MAG: energy transducer TonB [Paludibacteraceae bacterium]|jgi:TonB family C-terminal domain|nr:energy transducer TonB [Paludibacteraceae bacterium]
MRIKKSPQADLNNKRSMFTLIGLVITLGFAYICFEWSKSNVEKIDPREMATQANDEEEQVDNTTQDDQDQPEPEPEPEQPQETPEVPDIKVVDDTVKTTGTIKAEVEGQNKPDDMPKTQFKDDDEEGANEVPFIKVDKKAQFPGGQEKLKEYLSKNLSYPQIAMDEGIEGKVFVKFVVSSKGTIKDVKVIRSVDPALDQEAIRVVTSMPNWTPAEQHNKPCASYFTLPVNFVLNR